MHPASEFFLHADFASEAFASRELLACAVEAPSASGHPHRLAAQVGIECCSAVATAIDQRYSVSPAWVLLPNIGI